MDLIQRCLSGDREAFAALFQQYKNLVYRTACLMLGQAEEAEDVLQEVFVQVHRSLHTFQPSRGAFSTWLHRITVNCCLKRRRRRRLAVFSIDRAAPAALSPAAPSPEERLGEREAVLQALDHLSDKLRPVVVLRYYLDLSYAEIAQVLDIPLGTVKSRLSLALKTLRRALEGTAENVPPPRPSGEEVSA